MTPSPAPSPAHPPGVPTELAPAPAQAPGSAPALAPAVARTRAAAVASLVGLIVLGLAWELWLAPTGNRTLALKVVPLLFPLAGLLRNRMYTYRWVSLMVWLYFTEGIVRATSDRGLGVPLAIIETVLCLLLFTACALHVRWRLRHPSPAVGHRANDPVSP
jgi:uncharacterized membrane protein